MPSTKMHFPCCYLVEDWVIATTIVLDSTQTSQKIRGKEVGKKYSVRAKEMHVAKGRIKGGSKILALKSKFYYLHKYCTEYAA